MRAYFLDALRSRDGKEEVDVCVIELDHKLSLPPWLTYDRCSSTPQGRHSSLQTSTTSIIYFALVLGAIFALPERITVSIPKNFLRLCGRFYGNSTYGEGVLYALTKERDVKGWAHTHIGNSD